MLPDSLPLIGPARAVSTRANPTEAGNRKEDIKYDALFQGRQGMWWVDGGGRLGVTTQQARPTTMEGGAGVPPLAAAGDAAAAVIDGIEIGRVVSGRIL